MNIILLSGGSGKRLWPLSNETRSKQFLKLLKNENGENESMIQRIYGQIMNSGIDANIVIATGKAQIDSIRGQLGNDVDVVLEPERRNTFSAIALSSVYLALEKKMMLDEVVLVLPVDPYAELGYFSTVLEMEKTIKSGEANIALMGIKPTYPSAKYGYIIPKIDGKLVDMFIEKPTEEDAKKLIQEGALWNGGVFAFKLGYLLEIVKKYIQFNSFKDVESQYYSLPKNSFDYEVVEKEKSIVMVEYTGTWKDLGTWNTLTEVMENATTGKVIMADNCKNTHVINELDIPITVLGADDMVIAASPDGILVSNKHQSSFLKPFVDRIDQRPMVEEQGWGEYKILDYVTYGDRKSSLTKKLFIKEGLSISCQKHNLRDEIWTIVDGNGVLMIDDLVSHVKSGDVVFINKGKVHAIRAITDLHILEVQIGEELSESDVQ